MESGALNLSFVDGLAGALPFDDSSVDLVWWSACSSIFHDPQSAIDDIARVLRPGGRAVLLDSDHGTRIITDLDLEVLTAFNRAALTAFANPCAARHIPAQVRRAGLVLDGMWARPPLCSPPRCCCEFRWCDEQPMTRSNLANSIPISLRRPYGQCIKLPSGARLSRRLRSSASWRASSALEFTHRQRKSRSRRPSSTAPPITSRMTESAPASAITETMHATVMSVRSSLLAEVNISVKTAAPASKRKAAMAMISTTRWWPPNVNTAVSLEALSSQVPTPARSQAMAVMSRIATIHSHRRVRCDNATRAAAAAPDATLLPPPGNERVPQTNSAVPRRSRCNDAEDDRVQNEVHNLRGDLRRGSADHAV